MPKHAKPQSTTDMEKDQIAQQKDSRLRVAPYVLSDSKKSDKPKKKGES